MPRPAITRVPPTNPAGVVGTWDSVSACLLKRAAKLVVLALAGPMEAEDMGKKAPALIVAEGSTFWKNHSLRRMIEAESRRFLTGQLGREFHFFGGEQLNLLGAALAAFRS